MFYFALMAELWFDSTDFRWHLIVNDLLLTYRVLVAAKAWILLADIVDWTAFLCYVVLKTNFLATDWWYFCAEPDFW